MTFEFKQALVAALEKEVADLERISNTHKNPQVTLTSCQMGIFFTCIQKIVQKLPVNQTPTE